MRNQLSDITLMELKIVPALAKEHYYKVTFKKEISTLE